MSSLKFGKTRIVVLLLIVILSGLEACKTKKVPVISGYPVKTAAYWTCPTMSQSQADSLSLHDIVIICIENQFNNYNVLQHLKKLNPKIKLLGYYNSPEMWENGYSTTPWQSKIITEIKEKRQDWLLKTNRGEQVIFWKGMVILNMSDYCPLIEGETYNEWIADKLNQEIFSDTIWDGHFLDNGGGNIFWVNDWSDNSAQGRIDANRDGQADSQSVLDSQWSQGIAKYLISIRQGNRKGFIIIANKGSTEFSGIVDGKFFENFPNDYLSSKQDGGWQQCQTNAKQLGPYTIFQVTRQNLNFGLASALLLDNVYIAIGQDDPGLFRSFAINLGEPDGGAKVNGGRYFRKYQFGEVEVFPAQKTGNIKLH